jgi:hypothetical protein
MRHTTAARSSPADSRPESAPPRRRGSTLSEIERHELRVLESSDGHSDHFDDERTNPWFPPTGPEPRKRS